MLRRLRKLPLIRPVRIARPELRAVDTRILVVGVGIVHTRFGQGFWDGFGRSAMLLPKLDDRMLTADCAVIWLQSKVIYRQYLRTSIEAMRLNTVSSDRSNAQYFAFHATEAKFAVPLITPYSSIPLYLK